MKENFLKKDYDKTLSKVREAKVTQRLFKLPNLVSFATKPYVLAGGGISNQ